MKTNKQIFIDACNMLPVKRTPVWIMRQAGRYLPEYRKIRSKSSFHSMMHTPELMAKVTLLPINRFNLDAAIMFSDILVVPESLGMKFELIKGLGPVFDSPINNESDIKKLNFNEDYFKNIYSGISLIRETLNRDTALIGFAGTPWTTACYMVEGRPSKDYMKIRTLINKDPVMFKLLMEKITKATIDYIDEQIKSGVNAVQLFDSNASYISKDGYEKFSLPYIKKIINHINSKKIPSIYFPKGLCNYTDLILSTNAKVIGVDWSVNIGDIKNKVDNKVALQGNLDPAVLLCPNHVIEKETSKVLNSFGNSYGHIFNLGHGITPSVNPNSVEFLIETVNKISSKIHG
tara:strand:- start:1148 stop:2188 length:1041 start_codon:yes stop_codon:yes gene_type:complete